MFSLQKKTSNCRSTLLIQTWHTQIYRRVDVSPGELVFLMTAVLCFCGCSWWQQNRNENNFRTKVTCMNRISSLCWVWKLKVSYRAGIREVKLDVSIQIICLDSWRRKFIAQHQPICSFPPMFTFNQTSNSWLNWYLLVNKLFIKALMTES